MNIHSQQANGNPSPVPVQQSLPGSAAACLNVFTVDGRLVVLPPDDDNRSNQGQCPLLRTPRRVRPSCFRRIAHEHRSRFTVNPMVFVGGESRLVL
jgi:hypothetical protein